MLSANWATCTTCILVEAESFHGSFHASTPWKLPRKQLRRELAVVEASLEVTSMEAFVKAFVEAIVKITSVEAIVQFTKAIVEVASMEAFVEVTKASVEVTFTEILSLKLPYPPRKLHGTFNGSFHGSYGNFFGGFHGSFHRFHSFHIFHGSFHGSGESVHGSFHKLLRKMQVVQETIPIRRNSFRFYCSIGPNSPKKNTQLRLPRHGLLPIVPSNGSETFAELGLREPRDERAVQNRCKTKNSSHKTKKKHANSSKISTESRFISRKRKKQPNKKICDRTIRLKQAFLTVCRMSSEDMWVSQKKTRCGFGVFGNKWLYCPDIRYSVL